MALLILAHPNFEKSLANKAIVEELITSDINVEIRNIASLYPNYNIDAKIEQEFILKHKNIIFQYPIYWYNMPAILKQWFDVVLEYGFAYGSTGDKLKGKNFIPSFTVGAPEKDYKALGEHHFKVNEFCKNIEQTAYYTQMNYIDPIYFHETSVNSGFTKEEIILKAKHQAKKLIEFLKSIE